MRLLVSNITYAMPRSDGPRSEGYFLETSTDERESEQQPPLTWREHEVVHLVSSSEKLHSSRARNPTPSLSQATCKHPPQFRVAHRKKLPRKHPEVRPKMMQPPPPQREQVRASPEICRDQPLALKQPSASPITSAAASTHGSNKGHSHQGSITAATTQALEAFLPIGETITALLVRATMGLNSDLTSPKTKLH